jgi:glycosyltransferase involved in cell wall biosynthesis
MICDASIRMHRFMMLVSILINNYNYGRFLREAIDSALNQTYSHTEVIVVDDGSTDDSRGIIANYGDLIIPVFKENGGQASAINAGFAASRGDIVCFLDADDMFLPEKVALTVHAWKEQPQACLVYHQLQMVDAQKKNLGKPWPRGVWRGDIRKRVERSGGWWPRPATSGLSFSRSYLQGLFPVPEGPRLIWTDTYLAGIAPFFGSIIGLRMPLTLYRIHGENNWASGRINDISESKDRLETLKVRLDQYVMEFNMLKESLHTHLNYNSSISLDDHLEFQKYLMALGDGVSFFDVIIATIRCPSLPISMRLIETAKMFLNRW